MDNYHPSTRKLTALWAFSEAALGGILHGLRVPFTGIVIGGLSVIFISLIGYYSENKTEILKSMVIVITIKFVVSPHSPVAAYFAVFLQGCIGFMLFNHIKSHKISAFVLAVLAMFFSSVQKVIVYTVVFGLELWNSLDMFLKYIVDKIPFLTDPSGELNYSYLIITFYVSIHLSAGVVIGILALRLPIWISELGPHELKKLSNQSNAISNKRRKKWFKRKSVITILILSIVLLILTYLLPDFNDEQSINILIMIIRAVTILMIWYSLLLPLVTRFLKKVLNKNKMKYSNDIEEIMNVFPQLKSIYLTSWNEAKKKGKAQRIKYFLVFLIVFLLYTEEENNVNNLQE